MKAVLKVAAVLTLTLFTFNAHAIKWQKCVQKSMKEAKFGEGKTSSSFRKAMGQILGQSFTSTSTSTTSYVSSTGECGAFAIFKVREEFIAENFDQLREESARGEGEYLTALASLSGCNSEIAQAKFQTTVRSKFNDLYFPTSSAVQPTDLGRQVDDVIKSDSTLNHMCQFKG